MKKISVIIADDHPIVCIGISQILAKVNDIELVGETADSAQRRFHRRSAVLSSATFISQPCYFADINMPGETITSEFAFVKQAS